MVGESYTSWPLIPGAPGEAWLVDSESTLILTAERAETAEEKQSSIKFSANSAFSAVLR